MGGEAYAVSTGRFMESDASGQQHEKYVADKDARQYRRSLYVLKRTSPHPMMTLFDAPSREQLCAPLAY